jgi:Integral membrane protein TerC family
MSAFFTWAWVGFTGPVVVLLVLDVFVRGEREISLRRATILSAFWIAVVMTTDVVFAVDSIPAIFAITSSAFIVWMANAFRRRDRVLRLPPDWALGGPRLRWGEVRDLGGGGQGADLGLPPVYLDGGYRLDPGLPLQDARPKSCRVSRRTYRSEGADGARR